MNAHFTSAKYIRFLFVFGFFIASKFAFSQATPYGPADPTHYPRHETTLQRVIEVDFNGTLSGTTSIGQWTVKIGANVTSLAGSDVYGITNGLSNSANGPWAASITPTGSSIFIKFDASALAGHAGPPTAPWLLPSESGTLTVSFVNTGNTLTTLVGGAAVAAFGPFTSQNKYAPPATCTDVKFNGSGIAPFASLDQCAPVNTNFFRWTYEYTLLFRNSVNWVTLSNLLIVKWNDPGLSQSNLKGYLTDAGGTPNSNFFNVNSFATGVPSVFLSFRSGWNPVTLTLDGTNSFTYAKGTNLCNFVAVTRPYNGAYFDCVGGPTWVQSHQFDSYDYDNGDTGQLGMTPVVPPANGTTTSNLVCVGTNVGAKLSDNSLFNCIGNGTILPVPGQGAAATPINNQQRWVRFIYGGGAQPASIIPDIHVNGTQVTTDAASSALVASLAPNALLTTSNSFITDFTPNAAPTTNGYVVPGVAGPPLGSPDQYGVIELNVPATATTSGLISQLITTIDPSFQVVGQQFNVTIQYWNACNPYPASAPVEYLTSVGANNAIQIITKPAKLTPTPLSLCYGAGTGGQNFNVTGLAGGETAINWYNKNPQLGGATLMTNSIGTNSANFKLSDYKVSNNAISAPINTSQGGGAGAVYSVWATQVVGGTNACESNPVEIVLTIQPQLSTPGVITGTTPLCVGSTNVAYSLAAAAPTKTIAINNFTNSAVVNLPTQYLWTFSNGDASVNAPNTTQAITADFTTAGSTTLQVLNQYVTAPNCNSANSTLTIQIDATTVPGTISPSPTICNGASTGNMTLSGQTGAVIRWERQYNGGGYNTIAGTAGLTIFSEVPGLGSGTYNYRAVVQNGTCLVSNLNSNIVTVNPIPPQPTISQTVASTGLTICADGVQQTVLQSSNVGGLAASFQWFKNGVAVGGATSSTITLNTVAQSGSYTVQAIGVASSLCPSVVSAPVVVTINPLPTASNPTGGGAVCAGNPAPDIVWNFTAGTAPFSGTWTGTAGVYSGTFNFAQPGVVLTATSITLTSPITLSSGTYKLLSLVDANGCPASPASISGLTSATISIGGSPPTFTVAPSLAPTSACDAGAATTDPQLNFTLDAASASLVNFTLTYKIDASGNRTKTFNTNAASQPTAAITFSDVELNAVGAHTVTIVSILSNAGCLSVFNTPLTFTVNPLPVLVTPQTKTICSGAAVNYEILLTPANTPAGTLFSWPDPDGAGPATAGVAVAADPAGKLHITDVLTNTTGAAFNVTYVITPTSSLGCVGTARNVVVTVNPAPVINAGQVKTICSGSTVNLEVLQTPANTPAGTVFNWPDPDGAGPATAGVNVAADPAGKKHITDVLTNTTGAAINVTYVITPKSSLGCFGAPQNVVITVNPAPVITAGQTKTICSGSAVNLEVKETPANAPAGTLFNWPDPDGAGPATAGVNVAADPAGKLHITDVLTNVTGVNTTVTYNITPTSSAACVGTTVPVIITIQPAPKIVAGQTKTICSGQNASYEILLSPLNLPAVTVFNWPDPDGAGPATAGVNVAMGVAGTKHILDILTNVTASPINVVYAVTPSSGAGCVGATQNVTITVNPLPINNPIQGNTSVCTGNSIILYQLDPTFNPGSTYTWSVIGTPAADVTLFGGGGTNTSNFFVLLKFPAATGTVALSVFETLNGCNGPTSNMTVTVNSAPPANSINGLTQVCTNQTAVPYSVATPNGTSTYAWLVTGATPSGSGSTINVDFGLITPVTIQVTETASSGCVGAPASTTVTVNSRPLMTSSSTSTVCSGSAPALAFSSSLASTYAWTVSSITGSITGATVGQVGSGNLSATFTGAGALRNTSGAVGSVTFNVTPTATAAPNCQGATQSVVVTVNPEPVLVNPQTATICSGQQVNYTIQLVPLNLPGGTIFNWPAPLMSDASSQGSPGVNVSASGGPHITDNLINNSASSITATYTITPTSGSGCAGTPRTVVVTVNPQPAVSNTLGATICSGSAIGLTLTTAAGSVAANNYNITSVTVPVGLTPGANAIVPANGVGSTYLSNDSYLNITNGSLTASYTVVPVSAAGCLGAPKIINFQINPQPSLSNSLDMTLCSRVATGLTLATAGGSPPAVSYNITGITIAPGLVAGGSNAIIPALNKASNYLASDVFTNTGNTALTVVYQVVPVSALSCPGDPPKSITMTINPEPVIGNGNITVCSRTAIGLTLITNGTSVAAANYNIISRTIQPGLVAGGINAAVPVSGVPAGYLASDVFTNTTNSALTVQYVIAPVSATPCIGQNKTITVTINPEPVMSSSLDATVCSDNATGLVLNTNGTSVGAANYNITARAISGGLTANVANAAVPALGVAANYLANDIFTNTGPNQLSVTYTVVPVSSSGCVGAPLTITIKVNPEPVVSTSLGTTVCSIVPIGLTLNTNGSSVAAATYNITAITIAGGLAPGSNAVVPASNVVANYLANDTYSNVGTTPLNVTYTVVPISAAGCVGNPQVITLTVSPEPVVSNALNATVCSEAAIGLTLNTNGTSVAAANYNISLVSIDAGLVASGTNAAVPASGVIPSYLINDKYTNTGNSSLKVVYTVVPLSAAGCPGPSKTITITINPEPVVSTGLNSTVCSDASTGLTLNTNGSSVAAATYNVTARTVAGGLTPKGTNATVPASGVAANYLNADAFTNITTLPLNVTYTVVGVSGLGCTGQPQVITISINPEPVLLSTLNATLCSSTAIGLTLNTTGTSVAAASYNITNISLAAGLTAAGTNAVIPFTGASNTYLLNDQFINTTAGALTATYIVVPVSAANCVGNPVNVVMTINPEPVVSNLLNETICSDVATGLILNTNGSSVAALNYNITARTIQAGLTPVGTNVVVPATGVVAGYLSSDKFTNTTSNVLTVTYTVVPVSGANCSGAPKVITITINPKPVLSGSLNLTQCSGVSTGLVLNTNGTSVAAQNYNITAISVAAGLTVAGTNATVPAAGVNAGYLGSDSFTNTGSGNLNVVYTVVPVSAAGCAGVPMPVTITIQPQPVVATTLNNTLCSGQVIGLTLTTNGTSVTAANYNVTAITISGGLVAGGSNAVIANGVVPGYLGNDVFTNTTNSALTVIYTVVPVSAANCLGDPQNITMTINPEPVVSTTLDKTVCSGTNIALTLNTNGSSVAAANYSITAKTIDAGLTPAGTNVSVPASNVAANYLASDKFTNVGATQLKVQYTVVPTSAAGCVGQPKVITITINPEPVMANNLNESKCSSLATGLTLNTNGTSVGASSYNVISVSIGGTLTAAGTNAGVPNTGVASNYLASDVFKNISNAAQTVTYVVAPVSGAGCVGQPINIQITVNPEPVGSNVTDPQCATTLNHSIQSQITNSVTSVFTYTVSSDNAGVPAAGNRVVTSAAPITDIYTNNTGTPANLTYTITPFSSANNCQGASFTYIVTISPTPVGANSTLPALCSRSAISINPQGSITNGVISTFTWVASYAANLTGGTNSGSGTITDKLTNLTASPLNATYTITPSSGPCAGLPFTIIQPVNPEPVMDPSLAAKTICSNNATSSNPTNIVLNTNGVSVAAASFDVSLVSQDIGLTGVPTTGLSLTANAIKNDKFTNTGAVPLKVVYQVTPKSAVPCVGAAFIITVTVNPEPVVAVLSNTVCSKDISNITLATNGASVGAASYKLLSVIVAAGSATADGGNVAVNSTGGVNLIQNDKYVNTSSGPAIINYSIVAFSGSGCEGQPQTISLTVNPEPILVPGLATVCSGVSSGIILGTAVGSAAITQYNLKGVNVPVGLTASGTNAGLGTYAVNNFLVNDQFVNTTLGPLNVTYTIAPVATGCVGNDYTVVLTINPSPAVANNLNATVCSNNASGIVLATSASSVGAASYNITNIVIAAGLTQTAGNVGSPRNGVTSNEIKNDQFTNTNLTNAPLTVTYTIVPVSASGCLGPALPVVLMVEPNILANPVAPTSICSNGTTNILLSSPSMPTAGSVSFNYTAVSSVGGLISGFIPAVSNLPNGTVIADILVNNSNSSAHVTYTITPVASGARGGSGCNGSPITVIVNVDPIPKLTASPIIQTVCEGVAASIVLNSTTVPSAGSIQFNEVSAVADIGLTLTSAPVVTYTSGQSIADVWKNDSTVMKSVIYTLQPVVNGGLGCVGNPVTITLNVNPAPNVTSTIINPVLVPAAICSNDFVNISLTSDVSTTINSWTASVTAGAAHGFSGGSGGLIFQTLQNTGSVPATVQYVVTPKASGCIGPKITLNIEVDPIPNVVFTAPTPVCYGGTLNVPLTSSVVGANFNWFVDPNNSGVDTTTVVGGTLINQLVTDTLTSAEDFLTYTITAVGPGATGCKSSPKIMSLLASPKMNGAFQNDSTWLCTGGKDFLQISLQGQSPFTLQYTDGTNNFTLTRVGNFKSIQIQPPAGTTTYKLTSLKDNLGCSIPLSSQVVYTVDQTSANFSIISPVAECTPAVTSFQFDQIAGTTYDWQWGDGSDSTYTAISSVSGLILKHQFINTSLTSTLKANTILTASLNAHFPNGCAKISPPKTINIYAQLKANVSVDKPVICSGDQVRLTNQTAGVPSNGNSWYYRYQGNATEHGQAASINVNYTLSIDSTMNNPQIVEVVYNATNGHCPADTVIQVTVYKSIKANFTDVVPFFVGGNATVTYNNTSKALSDWPSFQFDWDFGLGASPATLTSSATPLSVNYSSPGPRDVTLTATNIAALAAGLTCSSSITKTVSIMLAPLVAQFQIDPVRACYPSAVTVTQNLSTGDLYKWRVVDLVSRDTVASSNAALPVFTVGSDGSYFVYLVTSSSLTGQTATDTLHFVRYPLPQPIFDVYPTTVYVPDQEINTLNGSGSSATSWLWDFGDGGTSTDYQPTYKYKFQGVDSLKFTAQYDHGGGVICSATSFRLIIAKQGGVAKVPNAFTPSSAGPSGGVGGVDLYNYVFLPQVKGVEEFNMQIYDRWGNLVFESNNQTIGWDGYDQHGRLMPGGVYVYKLTLLLSNQERTTQVGDVTLIR